MRVVFNNNDRLIILIPVMDYDLKILADKDVPAGVYYKFIDEKDIPARETRSFWNMEINKDNADGIGLSKEEFYKKYPQYIGKSVK